MACQPKASRPRQWGLTHCWKVGAMPTANERLKRAREQRGWSQSFLAGQLGVPDSGTVSRWERGAVLPSQYYRQKLCALFDLSAEELGLLPPADVHADGASSDGGRLQTQQDNGRSEASAGSVSAKQQLLPAETKRAGIPRIWTRVVVGLLLLLVGGSGAVLGLFVGSSHSAAPPQVVGTLSFESSGAVTGTSNQGIADGVVLNLQSLAPPPPGQGYYAWLLPDLSSPEQPVVPLGLLTVRGGKALLQYSDPQHANLLAATSQLLVTAQVVTIPPPAFPTVEKSTWRYVAIIPQSRPPGQRYSLLDHLRHLLADDPDLTARGLRGGLTLWLYRNMQAVLELTINARGHWHPGGSTNAPAIRTQVIRILNYLDGTSQPRVGAPPVPVLTDARESSVALLQFDPRQNPPGYLAHIPLHIRGVLASPGATQAQRFLADQLLAALGRVGGRLNVVYQDAAGLEVMSDAQLQGGAAQSMLDEMAAAASAAFAGQMDPASGAQLGGVAWIYQNMPGLATIQVTPYQP